MAVKIRATDELNIPESTGAVPFDDSPQEYGVGVTDQESTYAVATPEVMEIKGAYDDGTVVVRYPTPGPVVISTGWAVQTKVVGPADPPEAKADPTPLAETK